MENTLLDELCAAFVGARLNRFCFDSTFVLEFQGRPGTPSEGSGGLVIELLNDWAMGAPDAWESQVAALGSQWRDPEDALLAAFLSQQVNASALVAELRLQGNALRLRFEDGGELRVAPAGPLDERCWEVRADLRGRFVLAAFEDDQLAVFSEELRAEGA